MKPTLIFLMLCLQQTKAPAQLLNTRWKTLLPVNQPLNCIIDFKQNTVSIYTIADSSIVESMTFTINRNQVTLLKTTGESDCSTETPGIYQFSVERDSLLLTKIKDECYDRSSALDNTKWKRWKDYTAIQVDEKILAQYTGVYGLDKQHPITISLQYGLLYAEGPGNNLPKSALLPIAKSRFFLKIAGTEMEFVLDAKGRAISLISHEGKDFILKRLD